MAARDLPSSCKHGHTGPVHQDIYDALFQTLDNESLIKRTLWPCLHAGSHSKWHGAQHGMPLAGAIGCSPNQFWSIARQVCLHPVTNAKL